MKCPISEGLPLCALVLCTCVPLEQGAASCYPWNPAAHISSSGAAGCGFPGRGDIPLPLLAKSRPVPHHLAQSAKGTCGVHMWTSGCDYVTKRSMKQGLTPTFPILLGLFSVQTVSHCRGRPLVQAWSFGASVATGSTSSLTNRIPHSSHVSIASFFHDLLLWGSSGLFPEWGSKWTILSDLTV